MLYFLIKKWVKATSWLFCKQIRVINQLVFAQKGPLLVVANHPNSFLDAILIGSLFTENIHFLARGDAFRQKKHRFLLKLLKMIPIYRLSEGKENLHLNEYAFTESCRILENGGIVLIFIEGICINSHTLQPFKKGAARIALRTKPQVPLKIIPISITYNSFSTYGKNVLISAGKAINAVDLFPFNDEANNFLHFNNELKTSLNSLIQYSPETNNHPNMPQKALAIIGHFLHIPLYKLVSNTIREKTSGTVFYDSVLFGVLMLVYPVYLLVFAGFIYWISASLPIAIVVLILHLILARMAILYKQ